MNSYSTCISEPFQNQKAESDPYRFELQPTWIHKLKDINETCLIIGAEGMGKTAASLSLVFDYTKQLVRKVAQPVLPVYWRYEGNPYASKYIVLDFLKCYTHTLLGYYFENPTSYSYASPAQQTITAQFMATFLNIEEALGILSDKGTYVLNKEHQTLIDQINKSRSELPFEQRSLFQEPESRLLSFILQALPKYNQAVQIQRCVVILDVQQAVLSIEQLTLLVQVVGKMSAIGLTIKAFVPQQPEQGAWKRAVYPIAWCRNELLLLVKNRFAAVDDSIVFPEENDELVELSYYCQPGIYEYSQINRRVIEACNETPKKLLKIIWHLLLCYERKLEQNDDDHMISRLDENDIDTVLKEFEQSSNT